MRNENETKRNSFTRNKKEKETKHNSFKRKWKHNERETKYNSFKRKQSETWEVDDFAIQISLCDNKLKYIF